MTYRETPIAAIWHKPFFRLRCGLLLLLGGLTTPIAAQAQVVPDRTIPQPSIVLDQGNRLSIQGGTISGTNLFHSFETFSIPESIAVFFDTIPANTQNIVARVTGDQMSILNGQLGSTHPASVFFMNPNGIYLGETAQLSLGGSFIATTASHIEFADGFVWSIDDIRSEGLLALNIPIGLQAGANPGAIISQSRAASQLFNPEQVQLAQADPESSIPIDISLNPFRAPLVGLEVRPGRTLALVGGDVTVDNGLLTAPSGQIYLASLGDQASVNWQSIDQTSFAFEFDLNNNFGSVDVRGASNFDVSGFGGGEIRLLGDRLTLQDQATLSALTLGDQTSRGIEFAARSQVQITGNVGIITATLGAGDSGDITIRSGGNVELTGLGNDNLQQLQLLQLTTDARSLSDPSVSSAIRVVGLNAASLGVGNAGDVTIAARNFQSSQGAILLTAAGGLGRGGDINLAIRETLDISNSLFQASSLIGSSGEAGNINIQATDLHLMENGSLASAALGSGNGGDINVRLSDTFRIDHADFSPGIPAGLFVNSLLGGGNAGNIDIQARAIELNGVGYISSQSGADFPGLGLFDQAGAGGNITIAATDSIRLANGLPNTISSGSITPNPAGNVSIQTPRLILQAGSGISVSNLGLGDAGALDIQADQLFLSDGSILSAGTRVGRSGGITIQADDLRLDRSRITTDAGSSDGGNIAIRSDTLVARNNSDITANAGSGLGGRVTIDVQGLFGASIRDRLTPDSDITASSSLGTDFRGNVTLTEPDLDTTTGLNSLPTDFVTVETIRRNTCNWAAGSTFYVTGTRSLQMPPDIVTPLGYEIHEHHDLRRTTMHALHNLGTPTSTVFTSEPPKSTELPTTTSQEANSWQQDTHGNIVLQANSTASQLNIHSLDCGHN
jgi:filamentous hemagglutinin family protein